jgi:hypothetical protein
MKAFSVRNSVNEEGMDLRDYFAAAALPALISDPDTQRCSQKLQEPFQAVAASLAYHFADEMIKARGIK